jgi:dinuclear metal center YbgI/SA1388 family protein
MKIGDITKLLEKTAPLQLQESYDNSGLLTGNPDWECTGALICLDCTEEVIKEAIAAGCNMIIAHHPVIFTPLKRITGKNQVERTLIAALKNNLALYAIHTNLDNVLDGVNHQIAEKLGLTGREVLMPRREQLVKLVTYCPTANTAGVLDALFAAGAGQIGRYRECSFKVCGTGTFLPGEEAQPFIGEKGKRHLEPEDRIELTLPVHLQEEVFQVLKAAHPYEEVAYHFQQLKNSQSFFGSGILGSLPKPMGQQAFLEFLAGAFNQRVIRHSPVDNRQVHRVAVCGGAGAPLTSAAKQRSADAFVTADLKYHEFFEADNRLLLADIGHFESEQYTVDLLFDILKRNFPTFAFLKTTVNTNPVRYFVA